MKLGANLSQDPGDMVARVRGPGRASRRAFPVAREAYAGDAVTAIAWAGVQTSRIVLGSAIIIASLTGESTRLLAELLA